MTLMLTQCRDSCSGIGPTFGIINFKSKEYFAGVAVGAAYMGSVWMDLTARFKEDEVNQVAVTWGVGMFAMVYIGGGLDLQKKSPFAEAGLTLKIPVEL